MILITYCKIVRNISLEEFCMLKLSKLITHFFSIFILFLTLSVNVFAADLLTKDSALRATFSYHPNFTRTELAYESAPVWSVNLFNSPFEVRLDGSIAFWHTNHSIDTLHSRASLWQVGVTPMFRWYFNTRWYIEGGIGATLMSHTRFYNKEFSTAFQFGDHIGIGAKLNDRWRLGLRYSHYSNGGIKKPNPGFDTWNISLSRSF